MPASTTAGIHSAWRAGGLRSTARAHHPRAGLGRHGAAAGSGAGAVLGVGRDEQARPVHRAGARSCRYSTFLLALDVAEKKGGSREGRAPARPAAVSLVANTGKSQAQKKSPEALFCSSVQQGCLKRIWSGKRDSNSRPQPWQGCALPTELFPQI